MKNRMSRMAAFLLLVCLLAQTAQAAQPRAAGGTPVLGFNGTTAVCSVICRGNKTSDEVAATLTLYCGNSVVDSWSSSGGWRVTLSGSHAVTSGQSYILELTWSLNDVAQPPVSVTATCP